MKKIISLALTLCMVITLFVAAIPAQAAVALPDGTIAITKEVTKDVSLSEFKLFAYNHAKAYTDSNGAEHAAGWDSLLTNAEYQSMIKTDATRGEYIRNDANLYDHNYYYLIYPLAENQQLKKISYTVKHLTYNGLFAPMMALNHSGTGKYYLMLYQNGVLTENTHRNVSRRFDTAPDFASYYSSTPVAVDPSSMLAANAQANASGFTLTKNDPGTYQFQSDADVTVEFSDSSIDFSFVQPSAELSLSYSAVAANVKQYPLLTVYQTYSGTTVRDHWYKNIQITYTESVDMTEEVEDFVEANPLALEIRNGLAIADIPSAKLGEYATKAASLKESFAAASAELQGILKEYGYYNESLVDLIVNINNVAATLPDETITDIKEVTKTVSITDFNVLTLHSNKKGYLTTFDKSYFVDSDVFSEGKALFCPKDETLGTEWIADFWYPLTDAQTLKEVSFKVNSKVESYIYFAANNANGILTGRYGPKSSAFGKQHGNRTLTNADGVDATANTLDSLYASGSTALQALAKNEGWTTLTPTYVPNANGETLETLLVPWGKTYDIVYTYENSKTDFTIINSDGASMTDTLVNGTQKNYPVIRLVSKNDKAYHISEITITYTEPVDVKAQVAQFVAANPFALDIRNNNIDLTTDLSQYKEAATALTAAYNAADENLQATLTQYGYYDQAIINVILGGADAINEYKTEHSVALGISALAVKDIAASYDTYKALYDAAVADLSSVESYIELGMGADIEPALDEVEAALAEALKYKGYANLVVDGTLKYENGFEGEETLEQVHTLTYPYDESKSDFADNGKEYVNTTNKTYALPDTLKGFDINTSSNAFGIENRFYYKVYNRNDLRFANQYSANKYLWAAAKDNGLALDRVTGVFNANGASWVYAPAIIYSYTDANHYSLISINGINPTGTTLSDAGMSAGNFKVEEYVYDADNTESPLTLVKAYPTITIGKVAETDDGETDGWIKFSFTYNEDGTAQFTFINDGQIYSVSTQNTTSAENKFFAMAKLTGVNINNLANPIYYGGRLYVDNLEIVFEEDENLAYYAKANDYRVEWEEIFLRNADFVAPYDVAEITAAKAAYDALDAKTQAHLTEEGVTAKLTALVNAAAKWDVTDDASVVASYKTNFSAIDASNYKIAYNIYNRLTAAQKAELSTEYEAMLALFAAETEVDNTTDIVVMGDSNTAGYGVTTNNDTTKRWTSLLADKLGSDYTVSNGGISGYRLVNDTTNIEGLQFRETSVLWTQSHTMGFDMVVVALGTNDASLINNQDKAEKWEALYEEFIQSYLAIENSPTLVLANFGRTKSATSTERDTANDRVNAAIKNIADKYGITLIDIDAMYDVEANLFQSDNLHWNEAGHEWMAGHYYNAITAITANAYSLADQKVFYNFDAEDITATVNGFVPEILGATIKNSLNNQDMRFAVNVSKNVPVGKEVAEYGMILADYRNITSGALSLADLNVDNTEDGRVIIGRSKEASNDNLGTTYYVNVGGISEEDYGAPLIARAYVKFTDGTVVYSVATTEGADYATRTGVKAGYAVRSIVSITKAMLVHLDKQGVVVSDLVKIENGKITAYINEAGQEVNTPEDVTKLFARIQQNVSYLANK